jgi:hypothetical protein
MQIENPLQPICNACHKQFSLSYVHLKHLQQFIKAEKHQLDYGAM